MSDQLQPAPGTPPNQAAPASPISIPRAMPEREQTRDVADARRLLLDPQAIAERHDPGAWERCTQSEVEVSVQLDRLPKQIKELSRQREAVGDDLRSQERQREELERACLTRSRGIVSRVYQLFGTDPILGDIRERLHHRKLAIAESQHTAKLLDGRLIEARGQLDALPEPSSIIDQYSREISRRSLSREEKIELLRPEVLASLSLEEFVQVWRRLNPYFVAHVTRQGIRDHNAMFYHSAGMLEYHDGFGEMLRKGHELRAPRAVSRDWDPTDRESVRGFLVANGVFDQGSEELARERFHSLVHDTIASAPKYADKGAVHFAAQVVLDAYYGGEKDNEVFVVYPSDFIASQYFFSFGGWEKDFTRPQSESKWNDVFVWDRERVNTTIPLDAGIVFLPRSTMVDRMTGSKYALAARDENTTKTFTLKRHDDFDARALEWAQNIPPESDFGKAVLSYSKHLESRDNLRSSEEWRFYDQHSEYLLGNLATATHKTLEALDVPSDIAESTRKRLYELGQEVAFRFQRTQEVMDEARPISLVESETSSWLRYTREASDPIPARDFWENYFSQNPELRPRHVVYYDGDPTKAAHDFLVNSGVADFGSGPRGFSPHRATLTPEDRLLGFDEHFVADMSEDPRANRGLEELTALGDELLRRG